MSTSTSDLYVWAWLPGEAQPVPAGVLATREGGLSFAYGAQYLKRPGAISVSPTIPLEPGWTAGTGDMGIPSAIRDSAPDAWGRRVILNRLTGRRGTDADTADLTERTYLIESSSNRIGALDFQDRSDDYVPRVGSGSLQDMQRLATLIAAGDAIPEELHVAVLSGTGIGGARPKSLISDSDNPSMVKFSLSTDVFPTVEAEALASRLAALIGMDTAPVHAMEIGGRYALISERFDRVAGGGRRMVVSGLTISGSDETNARYVTYPELVTALRANALEPVTVGPEMFERIAFSMAISNNDDHLRNHAAFWDGTNLDLTPAYDLAPVARREGAEAFQTLAYGLEGQKVADLAELIKHAELYDLTRSEAAEIVDGIRAGISDNLISAAEEMNLPEAVFNQVRGSFLHSTVTANLPQPISFSPPSGDPDSGISSGPSRQLRRGQQGLGKTAGGGNRGSYAQHVRPGPKQFPA